MKIFNGTHTEERPEELNFEAFEFIHQIFTYKQKIAEKRKLNPKKEYSIFP